MYTEYFKFSRRPFELLPDSEFLYLTRQHSRAIANIEFALMNRDSFVIITGEVGIGKTTILNRMANNLSDDLVLARITHTTLSPTELLQAILSEFNVPCYKKNRVLLLDELRAFLLELSQEGKHAVIMVDEAQNLSHQTLEEMRLLSCIDAGSEKLLSIVLVGQPVLNTIIDSDEHKNLRDRTRLRQHLLAMNPSETRDYVRHRLEVVGGDIDEIFDAEAVLLIHEATGGIPRLINTLCDTALTAAFVENKEVVCAETVQYTIIELDFDLPRWSAAPDPKSPSSDVLEDDPDGGELRDNASVLSPALEEELDKLVIGDAPWFMIYHDGECCGKIVVEQVPFIIGRDSTNSYAIDCRSISRRHAVIVRNEDNGICVEDLGSTNGTYVNNRAGRSHILAPGDILSLGLYELVYRPEKQPKDLHLVNVS